MAEVPAFVIYSLNSAKTLWQARGRAAIAAPPYTPPIDPPPVSTTFTLTDPASLLGGGKVLS